MFSGQNKIGAPSSLDEDGMVFSFLSLLLVGVSFAAEILSSYDFGTKGLILSDTSAEKIIGDLALQGDVSFLPDRVGVRIGAAGFLSSINNITNLLPRLIATNGFSVEMFVEIDYTAPSNLVDTTTGAVLWGISTNYTNRTKPIECPTTTDSVNNPVNAMELRYTDVNGNNNLWWGKIPTNTGCQAKSVSQSNRYSGMIHVVLTAGKFYVNGTAQPMIFPASDPFNFASLDPLSLFYVAPIQNQSISFVGNLYKLYIYDYNLSFTEITAKKNGWIQNSPPFVSDKTVNLYEDGSQLFSLTAFDYDDRNQTQNVTCYVGSLPEKGWLTQNGVNISVPFGVPRDEVSLLYTPPQYGHGANYTNFSFYCSDQLSDSNNATVFFNISHVNHPPTSVNASTQAIRYQWTRIWLNGTDIDGDKINSVRISSLPQSGYLKQVASLSAAVGAGADILAPTVVSGSDTPKGYIVDYRFNLSVGTSGSLFVQNDTFTYSVADTSGVWSVQNATFTAIVNNNLRAGYTNGSTPNVTVKQSNANSNSLQTITLPGSDSAGNPWEAVILSLPDPLQGWFVDTDGVTNITSVPYTCTLPLIGNPKNQIYFKPYPIKKDPLSFSYAIQQQSTTWQSPPQQAMVKISPVQQAPSVVMNSNPLQLKDGTNGTISVTMYDPNIDSYSATDIGTVGDGYIVTVKGAIGSKASGRYWITCGTCVDSLIQDVSPCPVNVSCALNAPSPVGLIRFFCHKANKTAFEMALTHIAVKGFVPGDGTIQVSVRDGGRSTTAAKFSSFTPDSYETTVELAFTYTTEQPKSNGSYVDIPPWGLYCIYVGGSALFLIILFLCVRWCFKCCLCCQRSKKTEPCDNYEAAACDRL